MRLELENKYKILFIIFVVLGVYYPAISGGINSLDDSRIIDVYGLNGGLSLKDILLPGTSYYYRPIIELSYYLDNLFWGMDASFMHLENILIHAANAVLLFLVATRVADSGTMHCTEFPLLTALLFALHPLHTEAVSWIAGRTDPLAAFFVLLATYHLFVYVKENSRTNLYQAMFFLLLGCLTKEIVFFFIPAAAYLLYCCPRNARQAMVSSPVKRIGTVLAAFAGTAGCLLFIYFRFRSGMNSVAKFFASGSSNVLETGEYSIRILGFYAKKVFFPLPLNYATVTIELYYFWIGCFVILVISYLILKRSMVSALIISGALLIIPAILVAVFKIAWTPVAERYLYLPLAFFSLGISYSFYCAIEKIGKGTLLSLLLGILLVPSAVQVIQRNLVWQDNLALYQDSVEKSPNFGRLRNELAVALFKKGKNAEGTRQLQIGRRINDSDSADRWFFLNQLSQQITGIAPEKARLIILGFVANKKSADYEILKMLSMVDEQRLTLADDKQKMKIIAFELIDTYTHIYDKTREPFTLFRMGQLELLADNHQKAADYFQKAYSNAPLDAPFRVAAGKLAEKLGGK